MTDEEFKEAAKKMFDRIDINEDGYLIFDQFIYLYLKCHPEEADRAEQRDYNAWRGIYWQHDENQDDYISWDEAWSYLQFRGQLMVSSPFNRNGNASFTSGTSGAWTSIPEEPTYNR
jgi:hypothetical protein